MFWCEISVGQFRIFEFRKSITKKVTKKSTLPELRCHLDFKLAMLTGSESHMNWHKINAGQFRTFEYSNTKNIGFSLTAAGQLY